jgi:hypothetical protein
MNRGGNGGFRVFLLCTLFGALPAHAGLFDSTPPKPAGVSNNTILQIQSAFDDQR